MGYYTRFQLRVVNKNGTESYSEFHENIISENSGYDWNVFEDELKWYNYHDDMLAHSLKFPQVTFRVEGIGEEDGDMWYHWYWNGKHYKDFARIVWPEFDPDKME